MLSAVPTRFSDPSGPAHWELCLWHTVKGVSILIRGLMVAVSVGIVGFAYRYCGCYG